MVKNLANLLGPVEADPDSILAGVTIDCAEGTVILPGESEVIEGAKFGPGGSLTGTAVIDVSQPVDLTVITDAIAAQAEQICAKVEAIGPGLISNIVVKVSGGCV